MPQFTTDGLFYHSSGLGIPLPSRIYIAGHAATIINATEGDEALQEAIETVEPMAGYNGDIQALAGISHNSTELKRNNKREADRLFEEKARKLQKQGRWAEVFASMDSHIPWKASLAGLSDATYAFVLKSLTDCLPTQTNLATWGRVESPHCLACDHSTQTLLHILNNCSAALDMYAWRHDNVLLKLEAFLSDHVQDSQVFVDVVTDVSKNVILVDQSKQTVPLDIVQTPLRPDIVIVKRGERKVILIELTIPFETNFVAASVRKAKRYAPLVADIEMSGYKCEFLSFEFGSRGIPGPGTFKNLKQICDASQRDIKNLIKSISQTVIQCSFVIFLGRNGSHQGLFSIL